MNEDLANIFEKLNINKDSISPEMVNNIMEMFNNTSNTTSSQYSENSTPDFDLETILKMKSIIDRMNSKNDDPRSKLLNSLRPFLKDSRKSKLDQYMQLMNMSKIIDVLPFIGGDNIGTK